jgi:NAD(P)-dependent dehydrogenase (short-subunit alcohol dehydrogenase family)
VRFADTVLFATGGASGLGEATARRFADEGARVVVADIDAAGAESVAASLPDALAVTVDTADAAAVERAVATAVGHYGRIDVIFNNAGVEGRQQPLHEMDVENWERVTAVDASGVFHVLKYGIAAMLQTGGGSVINTSSTAGLIGQENISPYTFAKAGLIGLTRSAAIEYADRGVRVNAVAPSATMTPLVQRFVEDAPDPEEMRARLRSFTPIPGLPTPEDIAGAVAFLASDDARWITGHTLPVDGGYGAR